MEIFGRLLNANQDFADFLRKSVVSTKVFRANGLGAKLDNYSRTV